MKDTTVEKVDMLIEHLCETITELEYNEEKTELTKALAQLISVREIHC